MQFRAASKNLILFGWIVIALSGCFRETPRMPATADEERQDAEYLIQLYNTGAVNTLGAKSDDSGIVERTDYNRTRGRTANKDYWRRKEFRMTMVGYRLNIAAYPWCPHKLRTRRMMVGIAARSRTPPVVEWAITPFDQNDRETLKLGDEILGMGSEDITPNLSGAMTARTLMSDYANRMEPLTFRVRRFDREEKEYEILHITQTPQRYCNYEFVLKSSPTVNAYADDEKVVVHTKTLDVLGTDDELAAIMGHEIAHNIMRHIPKERLLILVNVLGRIFTIPDSPAGDVGGELLDNSFSRSFEDEADYVGIYLAAAAGYDPNGALSVMQVLARLAPEYIRDGGIDGEESVLWSTHPVTSERYTQLRKAIDQIKLKQSSGLPVMPDVLE